MSVSDKFTDVVRKVVGADWVQLNKSSLSFYSQDALGVGSLPDLVVIPGSTKEIASIARLCNQEGVPLVVRGGGTGYTGGAVPTHGGMLLSMERFNRILEIDEASLLAVVEPNVITVDLKSEAEQIGLYYPPDPASLARSTLGGNVAECAGGPNAFKYGTTKRYVLGLEAVLPTGEIIHTGSKAVKNVVGYDLTQLLVGSEGTLAIITKIILRLIPKPIAQQSLVAFFPGVPEAVQAVTSLISLRIVPAAIELVDSASLKAVRNYLGYSPVPSSVDTVLIVEVDGMLAEVEEAISMTADAMAAAGAIEVVRASNEVEREKIWTVRRELSPALKATGLLKINHDVVVPRGKIPELFEIIESLRQKYGLFVACFGHAGDGNIHVNIMVDRANENENKNAGAAVKDLFVGVVSLEGSISGEHGIGFQKSTYLGIELGSSEIELMKRIKAAFDPLGILNPGKIFPE